MSFFHLIVVIVSPPAEPSCPSGSQPWASFHPSVRTASSPGFLRWLNGNRERLYIRKLVSHIPSSFLSFSVLGKRELYTQRRILATKSRQPVRSSVPEPWGEDRREPWAVGGLVLRAPLTTLYFAFSSFVRFKISKVIVVGDLAVGKTCLINR